MTSPFLTYELLTPETADPVVIRITGQRERGFKTFEASNGVEISSHWNPVYIEIPAYKQPNRKCLGVWGSETYFDSRGLCIPLSDWPAVKQAIRELNEAKREVPKGAYKQAKGVFAGVCGDELPEETLARMGSKEKNMKEDRYEFPLKEWEYTTEPEPFEFPNPTKIILTRKKPRVEDRYKEVVDGLMATYDWSTHKHKEHIKKALSLLEDLMAEKKANEVKG